jgi:hypothetical protein
LKKVAASEMFREGTAGLTVVVNTPLLKGLNPEKQEQCDTGGTRPAGKKTADCLRYDPERYAQRPELGNEAVNEQLKPKTLLRRWHPPGSTRYTTSVKIKGCFSEMCSAMSARRVQHMRRRSNFRLGQY